MKKNNNLFDQFRDNAHKLDEQPSRHAWDKLENKLDAHANAQQTNQTNQTNQTTSIYRKLAIAASIAVLLAVTTVIGLFNRSNNYMAEANMKEAPTNDRPQKLEDLQIHNDNYDNEMYRVVEVTRRAQNRSFNPINEGKYGQRLLAKVIVQEKQSNSYIAIADSISTNEQLALAYKVDSSKDKKVESSLKPTTKKLLNKNVASSTPVPSIPSTVTTDEVEEVADIAVTTAELYDSNQEMEIEEEDFEEGAVVLEATTIEPPVANPDLQMGEYDEKDIYAEEDIEIASSRMYDKQPDAPLKSEAPDVANHNIEMKKAKSKKPRSSIASAKEQADSMIPSSSIKTTVGYSNEAIAEQFSWLMGKWEGMVDDVIVKDEWTQISTSLIKGTSTVMVSDQISFAEEVRIERSNGQIFYHMKLPNYELPIKFELITITEKGAIFENSSIDFPQQIMLSRNNAGMTTIFQNTKKTVLNEEQRSYFKLRNEIQKEQALRTLRKVD